MKLSAKVSSEKLEHVFSDPQIFEATLGSAEEFYAKFDKQYHFKARTAASRILKIKKCSLRKREVEVASQMAKKYRSLLLGQQTCNDDNDIVDQHSVSCSSDNVLINILIFFSI